jgi:hypothetical protein
MYWGKVVRVSLIVMNGLLFGKLIVGLRNRSAQRYAAPASMQWQFGLEIIKGIGY